MRSPALILLAALTLSSAALHAQSSSEPTVTIVSGSTEDGRATPLWLAVLRRRLPDSAFDSVAVLVRPTQDSEQQWAELIRSHSVRWPGAFRGLLQPFPGLEPRSIQIVLGNRGAEDAFSHDSITIGFDLAALLRVYGSSALPENAERVDRFFRHEATHTLQKRWLNRHPFVSRRPFDLALLDIWLEGLGNFYSLPPRWGQDTDLTRRTLAVLEPRFVERMTGLACADSVAAQPLLAGLSSGPFDQKWGALPAALWLQREQGKDTSALRRFVIAGPTGVLQLAGRNLPTELAASLNRLRDSASGHSLVCGR